jgi:hypothetical protein
VCIVVGGGGGVFIAFVAIGVVVFVDGGVVVVGGALSLVFTRCGRLIAPYGLGGAASGVCVIVALLVAHPCLGSQGSH